MNSEFKESLMAWMKAAKNGFTEIVEFLVTKGVDVSQLSFLNGDATALSLACSAGHKDIVKHLFKCGADPKIELKDGVTCVLEAARNGFVSIVGMMLDHGGVSLHEQTALRRGKKAAAAASTAVAPSLVNPVSSMLPLPKTAAGAVPTPPDPASYGLSGFPPAQPGHYVSLPADFFNSSALSWFASLFSGLSDGTTPVFPAGSDCAMPMT
ncbi:unnamed protein product [Cylicocyclus nassatus]|uniref:Uncharacterized protein n=1 Tax=Cylicocyclus nassatus TaxID=53992 RepID=A0AA36DRW8_CYLNA|nr:unnamed protein product [Cylicocyclus nassatus]